jgi:hypothetical protein
MYAFDRSMSALTLGSISGVSTETTVPKRVEGAFRHEALLYAGDDDFLIGYRSSRRRGWRPST